jgi:hypothetical protein
MDMQRICSADAWVWPSAAWVGDDEAIMRM